MTELRAAEEQLQVHERMVRLLADHQQNSSKGEGVIFPNDFIGQTPVMRKVFSLIERVAQSEATVLIGGESGTGKEIAARSIHRLGLRAQKGFVAVNCSAIPEHLIESQLFGHKKGAFTGAVGDHSGLFRQAEGGTLFLDEIGELPLAMQAKLLRVLQEKVFRPVGAEADISANVRVIGATNRNLKDEVVAGRFREDLYYRLNVIAIKLPPLRERKEDIPLLAQNFLNKITHKGQQHAISPHAMHLLLNYSYPGNVRELENILERALVLGGNVILPEHLPEFINQTEVEAVKQQETAIYIDQDISFPVNLDELLASLERHYLERALEQAGGARKKAADLLQVNMRSFRYRCQKYLIDAEAPEVDS